ncbi:MAG: hypothetical protein H6538_02500 [Bacteroidales bacterium]|nr:hypothetical protein [Bacteroidales bacterium]MCB8999269.1 hypothetical protein [Bacteroidales bacterium]MCB9013063.1 hypothetical protein [Bacteroidales bacterium]
MKSYLLFLFLTFLYFGLSAQDVIMDKDVDEQYQDKKGPNMRQYGHIYESFGLVVPYNEVSGAKTDLLRSGEIIVGYRYKLKLLSFYAIGYDLSYSFKRYGIQAEDALPVDVASNPFSQASLVKSMSLGLATLGGEVYNRINVGKRGNVLGNYLDIGIKGEWNYGRRLIIKDIAPDGDYYEKSRLVQRNLNYIEKFSALVTARIGINKLALYGNYRISDLISSGYTSPELPPLTAGIEFSF